MFEKNAAQAMQRVCTSSPARAYSPSHETVTYAGRYRRDAVPEQGRKNDQVALPDELVGRQRVPIEFQTTALIARW